MNYKGVIFDLDGVLLDSMYIWDDLGKTYLQKQGISPPDDLNKIIRNMSLKESASYFKEDLKVNLTINQIIEGINSLIEDKYKNELQLKPHVRDYIKFLESRNVKIALATETDKKLARDALKRLGILHFFDSILTSADVSVSKSSPKIYMELVDKLDLSLEDILIFEDSLYAVETAKEAGFDVVGVFDDASRKNIREIRELSDYFIYSFREMEELF